MAGSSNPSARTPRTWCSATTGSASQRSSALSIQGAVAQAAALEVGAVGIGAVVVALATTRFLDATGLIAAAIVAGYGLFILPNRRRKAREEFREKTDSLRKRLGEVVRRQFEVELEPLRRAHAGGHSPIHPFRPLRARPHDQRQRRPRIPRRGDPCSER